MNEPLVFSTFIEDLSIPCKQPLALQFFQYLRHLKLLCTPWSSFLVDKAFQVIHFFFERSFTHCGLIDILYLLRNLFKHCIAFLHLLLFSLHSNQKLFFLGEATADLTFQFRKLKLRQACKKIVLICDLDVALHFLWHQLGLVGLLKDFVIRIQRCQSDNHPYAVRHVVKIHPKIYFLGVCFRFKHCHQHRLRRRSYAVLVDHNFAFKQVRLVRSNRNKDFASSHLKWSVKKWSV